MDYECTTIPLAVSIANGEDAELVSPRYHSPLGHLPVELWEEILKLATSIPGKDEFSMDASSFVRMKCDEPKSSSTLTQEKYMSAIKNRLAIVRVCKLWYTIGIRILWSNVRLDLGCSPSYIRLIDNKLRSSPDFAFAITRMEVILSHIFWKRDSSYSEYVAGKFDEMLGYLTSLKIFTCPITFGTNVPNFELKILILRPDRSTQYTKPPTRNFWLNVRVMVIKFDQEHREKEPKTEMRFHWLESLCIKDDGGTMSRHIANKWHAPVLHTLSIQSGSGDDSIWPKFLYRCRSSLKKLNLRTLPPPPFGIYVQQLQMQNLEVLYVSHKCDIWFNIIKAPNVRRLGIFDLYISQGPRYSRPPRAIPQLSEIFPTVQEISLRKSRLWEPSFEDLETFLEKWRTFGIRVDIDGFMDA